MAEHRAGVLYVVEQRAVDVREVAARARDERSPMIVVGHARRLGEGKHQLEQVAPKQRCRARDGVGEQQRGEARVVVAALPPQRLRDHRAVGADRAGVAVYQARVADPPDEGRELVGMPAVVLVGEGDEPRLGRGHAEGALEVAVEAEAALRARKLEAGIVSDRTLEPGEALGARRVIAEQAEPVAVGLLAKRRDLALEELLLGLESRHAHRDERLLALGRGRQAASPAVCGTPRSLWRSRRSSVSTTVAVSLARIPA